MPFSKTKKRTPGKLKAALLACVLATGLTLPISVISTAQADDSDAPVVQEDVRPRTIITQDGEIDDMDSFVRWLYYANEFDIEGIIYSSSMFHFRGEDPDVPYETCGWRDAPCDEPYRWTGTEWLDEYIDEYEAIYPNLIKHADGYPTADELRDLYKIGNVDYTGAMEKDTEGSELIEEVLLDDDPRPVYVQTWGGLNTLARALKAIEDDYTAQGEDALAEVQEKIGDKLLIYNILNQDNTLEDYIKPNWPGVKVIDNQSQFWSFAYQWDRRVPEPYKYTLKADWMVENLITGHGELLEGYHTWGDGQVVPGEPEGEDRWSLDKGQFPTSGRDQYDFISEGDTPAFMFLFDFIGLRQSEDPTWGGWGGRFDEVDYGWLDTSDYNPYTGENDRSYPQTRWVEAIQNDFAARADWGVTPDYADANHIPQASVAEGVDLDRRPGSVVTLNGSATDPDGDAVDLKWWQYEEAGSFDGKVNLSATSGGTTTFVVPDDAPIGSTIHIILEATDDGEPALKHYQRVVITVAEVDNPPVVTEPTPTVTVTAEPSPQPTVTVTPPNGSDIYDTPGFHRSSGRDWMTVCEPYSTVVDRCWTYIWSTSVQQAGSRFVQTNGWNFNNLTYVGGSRAAWAANPLGHAGSWAGDDGRQWRTECDTANTGRSGCRTYATADVIQRVGDGYQWVNKEVFNNQVRFN